MSVHIWDCDSRLSQIHSQVVEAQRLTAIAVAQTSEVRANLARSQFAVVGDLSTVDKSEKQKRG